MVDEVDETKVTNPPSRLRQQPVQRRSEAAIRTIVSTAGRLIATHGADAVTTTMIAETAGLSVGSVYRYFPDRESIFNSVMRRGLDELNERLDAAEFSLARATWRDDVQRGATIMIEWARDADLAWRSLMYTSELSGAIAATNRDHDLALAAKLAAELPQRIRDRMLPTPEAVVAMYLGILDKGLELAFHLDPAGEPDALSAMEQASFGYIARYLDDDAVDGSGPAD